MLSEELILHFISKLYPKYEIREKSIMRVTRNADIDVSDIKDEDLDYRDTMEQMITKKTGDGFSYITQIGTGNYNEKTSRLYTDLSLMTADQAIGADAYQA